MSELKQECGKPGCPYYGMPDEPGSPAEDCPDDHVMDRHPRVDSDWKPSTYRYRNSRLDIIWITQTPIDEESALAEFHRLSRQEGYGDVQYLEVAPPGEHDKFQMLPYQFIEGEVRAIR